MVFCNVEYFRKMHCFDIFIFPLPNALLKFSVWRAQWHLKHSVLNDQESFVTVRRQLRWLSTRSTLREAWPMKLTIQHFFQIWAAGSEHLNQIWTTSPAAEMLSPPPAVWTAWGSSRISFYKFGTSCPLYMHLWADENRRNADLDVQVVLGPAGERPRVDERDPGRPVLATCREAVVHDQETLFGSHLGESDSWQLYLFVKTSSSRPLSFDGIVDYTHGCSIIYMDGCGWLWVSEFMQNQTYHFGFLGI